MERDIQDGKPSPCLTTLTIEPNEPLNNKDGYVHVLCQRFEPVLKKYFMSL